MSDLAELSTSWHSYPKIYTVGHAYLSDFFSDNVLVEEENIVTLASRPDLSRPFRFYNEAIVLVPDLAEAYLKQSQRLEEAEEALRVFIDLEIVNGHTTSLFSLHNGFTEVVDEKICSTMPAKEYFEKWEKE